MRTHSPEILALLDDLQLASGVDYRGWSPDFVARQVSGQMRSDGVGSVEELRARVLDDRAALERLVLDLAAPTRRPFSDHGWVRVLREEVVPRLRTYPSVRVWHIGCASADDTYTTAIVLREERVLERSRIYTTDESQLVLDRVRRGDAPVETAMAAGDYTSSGGRSSLAEYFATDGPLTRVRPTVQARIVFGVHSMATDSSFNEFQLIVCRGVLRRFGQQVKERALAVIRASLVQFGFVALSPDDLPVYGAAWPAPLRPEVGLYKRIA